MKVEAFEILNFRGIKYAAATDLQDTVIIAGQNGCGKSTVLEALRLYKSLYGGHSQNDWHRWMGEFSINVNSKSNELARIFQDPDVPLSISFSLAFSGEELVYLSEDVDQILFDYAVRLHIPEARNPGFINRHAYAEAIRQREKEFRGLANEAKPRFLDELLNNRAIGKVSIQPGQQIALESSILTAIALSGDDDHDIMGIIDYHGPNREYNRDAVSQLNIQLQENQNQDFSIFNYMQKYQNVKSGIASSYVKGLVAKDAGTELEDAETLNETLKELFRLFFPNKRYDGPAPNPDGSIDFPVKTQSGATHDLDDLSSGEKEILYGYLRMRDSAERNSIILIDEPELHLNPKLASGLASFYDRHLAKALGNQIWLVSHSDALIREAITNTKVDVFHMQPAAEAAKASENQLRRLSHRDDLNVLMIELIDDIAAYDPDSKIVLVEGSNFEFDRSMIQGLFPDFARQVNLVSGSDKTTRLSP